MSVLHEMKRRSVAKTLSWRVFATAITTTIAYVMTGEAVFAAQIGAADTVIKMVVYFAHERVWAHIPYGRTEHVPPPT